MKNLLLLKDIAVLELYAHLGRGNCAEYIHLHANRLRAMATGEFRKYRVSVHYDNLESMARSYGELSLNFINREKIYQLSSCVCFISRRFNKLNYIINFINSN